MNKEIPFPITFNTHKHHLHYLIERLKAWQHLEWKHVEKEIKVIGENLLDLYTGTLSAEKICEEILFYFNHLDLCKRETFLQWLKPFDYKKITLSDSSVWVVKPGNDKHRYLHIHPGKKSPQTLRVRASTLKTVLALLYFAPSGFGNKDLQFVNDVRTRYLKISPIKSLQQNRGIMKIQSLFINHSLQPHCLPGEH